MSSTTGQAPAGAAVIALASMAGSVPAQRVLSERPLRIALVAGEASGDLLGAGLVRELKARFPNAEFAGIGGDAMRSAGCQTWHDASELAVMGLTEVLRHLPRLLKLRSAFRQRALEWQPDVFIGIDAPDFNLGIERWLKQRGVRTVHYVSPSVWAWREKRAEKIGNSADLVLCLFPMEPPIYARHGIDARFVGHPMADDIPLQGNREEARAALGLPTSAKVLAVLPGSRLGEISRLGEPFFEAAWQVSERIPGLHVVVPAANPACRQLIEEQLSRSALPVAYSHVLDGQARNAMIAADVVVLASGTATLEAMLVKRPMVVGYRVNELTYRLVKALGLIKVDRFALPNILAGQDLAPELMQHDCTPDKLAAAIQQWFDHPQRTADLQGHALTDGAEGRDAVGLVTEVHWDEKRGRKSNFVLNVEFETEDGQSRVEKIAVSNDLGNQMRATDEAEEIDIRYNAEDPSVAVAVGEADNSLLMLWLAIASGVVTLALLAARLIQGRKAQPA